LAATLQIFLDTQMTLNPHSNSSASSASMKFIPALRIFISSLSKLVETPSL
jgi:hypothetical protein